MTFKLNKSIHKLYDYFLKLNYGGEYMKEIRYEISHRTETINNKL